MIERPTKDRAVDFETLPSTKKEPRMYSQKAPYIYLKNLAEGMRVCSEDFSTTYSELGRTQKGKEILVSTASPTISKNCCSATGPCS